MLSGRLRSSVLPEQGQGEAFPLPGYTGMECLVKGVAFRDTLAGLKGGSPHLGAGAKRPAQVEGKALAQSVMGTVT